MSNNITAFVPPPQSPLDALSILHQAADALTLDGKQHKILQEALRTIGELVAADKPK